MFPIRESMKGGIRVEPYYWDEQIDYLTNSRSMFYNEDYIEFLIKSVWKLSGPVHIVDFGCGLGYLGLKFLPYLPEGSKYTGIDKGVKLIRKAEENFRGLPFETEFIISDLYDLDIGEMKYDLAICQAFLMHLPDPKAILEKMIRSVKTEGKVICIEPHWISAMANIYVHEMKQSDFMSLGILQKLYELDAVRTGKDGNIGVKMPIYMRELGLDNIGCRINDIVRYINPDHTEEKAMLYNKLCDDGFAAPIANEEAFVQNLLSRGLSFEEAQQQLASEKLLHEEYSVNGLQYNTVYAPTMMISYGTKTK
ncbi:class I SAM-dependent methyltransferase [Paenibacillus tarimensis]